MIHTLRIPCPLCGTLLVDFEGPFTYNWGCLRCSAALDLYGKEDLVRLTFYRTPPPMSVEDTLALDELMEVLDRAFREDE